MKLFRNIAAALSLMMFIIAASVTITLNFRSLYYFDINHLNIAETSGIDAETIKKNYDILIDYNSMFNHDTLYFPDFAMSEHGRIHFEEVKVIFVALQYIFIATLILSIIFIVINTKKRDSLYLKLASVFTVVIPAALGIFIAANWEQAFVTFHHIFFSNDYWIFDPAKDAIITVLPDTFFMHCAIMILALVILGSIICAVCYVMAGRRQKTHSGLYSD